MDLDGKTLNFYHIEGGDDVGEKERDDEYEKKYLKKDTKYYVIYTGAGFVDGPDTRLLSEDEIRNDFDDKKIIDEITSLELYEVYHTIPVSYEILAVRVE